MNFVLGFVVLVVLIAAQNEPITSKTIYSIENDALCGQTGLQAGDGDRCRKRQALLCGQRHPL